MDTEDGEVRSPEEPPYPKKQVRAVGSTDLCASSGLPVGSLVFHATLKANTELMISYLGLYDGLHRRLMAGAILMPAGREIWTMRIAALKQGKRRL